mgnify:CR=1 FL=1
MLKINRCSSVFCTTAVANLFCFRNGISNLKVFFCKLTVMWDVCPLCFVLSFLLRIFVECNNKGNGCFRLDTFT